MGNRMQMRFARIITVLAILAGTLYPLYAQIPGEDWSRIALLGNNTLSIGISPKYDQDGTVFAGTSGSGLWRSYTQGVTWSHATSSTSSTFITSSIAAIAVSPDYSTDNTLYALTTDGKIYGSTDKGATFSLLRTVTGGVGTSLAISPTFRTDRTLWAGFDGQGLWYSTNAGANWTQESQSVVRYPNIHALEVSPAYSSNNTLYVGGHHTDYGPFQIWAFAKWQSASSGMGSTTPYTVNALTVRRVGAADTVWIGTEANGMYYSIGPPSTCVAACDGTTQGAAKRVSALDVSANSAPMLLEGRADGLYQSTSSPTLGTTCSASSPLGPIQAIRFEPIWDGVDHCHIFIGTPVGLFRKGCAVPLGSKGPDTIDGKCVALARAGNGAFIGTGGNGLFKSQAKALSVSGSSRSMVQWNNFPNKLTPDVVAIALDPGYDETFTSCSTDASVLFVAVNFPTSSTDNGVYKSTDWGNTWTKLTTGQWRTGTVMMYDLAISPSYAEGTSDTTLYAATNVGLFRWDGADGWVDITRDSKNPTTFRIGMPPTFARLGSGTWEKTLFIADAAGVYYNMSLGSPGYWTATAYTDVACNSPSTVTGFAFAGNFGKSGGTTRLFVSNSSTLASCGSIHTCPGSPFSSWAALNDGLANPTGGASDIATPWSFDETSASNKYLLCTTADGTYRGDFDRSLNKAAWSRVQSAPANAVSFEVTGRTYAINGVSLVGGFLSLDGGTTFKTANRFVDFNSLPNDVFMTLPHQRDPNTLFASSPSMGVFVSQDKGLSFRPWNDTGSCVIRSAYGLGMMKDRSPYTNWDVIWVGTGAGIMYHWMYYTNIDYPGYYWSATNLTTGRYERFSGLPPTMGGSAGRVYAASPVAGTGIYFTEGSSVWSSANSPGSNSPSVRHGYAQSVTPTQLTSGSGLSGQSVTYSNWDYYAIVVPSGQASLSITMTPTAGDPDLYVRYGDLPTQTLWDYRPYRAGLTVETVNVNFPVAGVWYIGVRGYASSTSTFNLLATYSLTAAPALEEADPRLEGKPEQNPFEGIPVPKAPSGGSIWGTVNHSGVYMGTPAGASVDWQERNGIAPNTLTNLEAQTAMQLKDGTVVVGCYGDSFYSPDPDEGLTTWLSSTAQFAGCCSYDFRDLYEVNLAPTDDADFRTDALIAAYGTGTVTCGGVWLSGDKGHHWMKISSGFDPNSQKLGSIAADVVFPTAPDATTSYYSSTDGTGVYTRTLTLQPYPTVTSLSSASGPSTGGGTLTVTGTGFSNACPTGDTGDCLTTTPVVLFGEIEATSTSWVDTTHLTAVVPPHTAGAVSVSVRNPDTRRSVTNATYTYSCALSPSSLPAITAVDKDPYLKSGVDITWSADPGAWQDGGSTGRLYRVLRSGVDISGALPYGVAKYTDTTGTANVSYNYAVTYTNGCGLSATTATAAAADQFLVPPEAASTPAAALQWTSGLKTQLTWGATTGATGYNLYKGTLAELKNLGVGSKVCLAYQGAGISVSGRLGTTTTLSNDPPSGSFYWYVLTATNGAGQGPLAAGEVVSSTGACASP
jgi:hypothetical protein